MAALQPVRRRWHLPRGTLLHHAGDLTESWECPAHTRPYECFEGGFACFGDCYMPPNITSVQLYIEVTDFVVCALTWTAQNPTFRANMVSHLRDTSFLDVAPLLQRRVELLSGACEATLRRRIPLGRFQLGTSTLDYFATVISSHFRDSAWFAPATPFDELNPRYFLFLGCDMAEDHGEDYFDRGILSPEECAEWLARLRREATVTGDRVCSHAPGEGFVVHVNGVSLTLG